LALFVLIDAQNLLFCLFYLLLLNDGIWNLGLARIFVITTVGCSCVFMEYLDRSPAVVYNVLFLVALDHHVLGFVCVCIGALPDPLNGRYYFLVLWVWIRLLEWIFISDLRFAYLQLQHSFVRSVAASV
jgi:hypothetical protein